MDAKPQVAQTRTWKEPTLLTWSGSASSFLCGNRNQAGFTAHWCANGMLHFTRSAMMSGISQKEHQVCSGFSTNTLFEMRLSWWQMMKQGFPTPYLFCTCSLVLYMFSCSVHVLLALGTLGMVSSFWASVTDFTSMHSQLGLNRTERITTSYITASPGSNMMSVHTNIHMIYSI